ncbi:hypothetical protein [Plectonema phage Pbo-yong3]|uniref:hypothetical protein n=1 Tax=Plectonema phage Pbo-yong3 TaxID=2970324 RepID=UPI00403C7FF2|nr:hypothetical protein [Plectonema phage Pbo-yong3]
MFPADFQPDNTLPSPKPPVAKPKPMRKTVDSWGDDAVEAGYDPRLAKLDAWGNWYYPSTRNWV